MKRLLFITFLLVQTAIYAQKPCEFSTEFNDTLGSYKETKTKIMYEKVFGNSSSYIIFSLANDNGYPMLKFQAIQKSKDFIKVNCFDKNSKMYLQLANGKIITLLISGEGDCGTMVRDETQTSNIRLTSASFLFMKNTIEELKKSPIAVIRIRYSTETVDFPVRSSFVSELDQKIYNPETFFVDYISCLEQ